MKKNIAILLATILIFTLVLSACGKKTPIGDKSQINGEEDKLETNKEDEDKKIVRENIGVFDGITFTDEEVNNDILKENDLTMINIWATFCPPCIDEMPDLGEINREYREAGKSFAILGIATDVADIQGNVDERQMELAEEIIQLTNADYTHILPGEDLIKGFLYKFSAVPTTVFVNKEGDVLKTVVGARDKNAWIKIIDEVMLEVAND